MNTPLQPVGMDHSHTSTIHLTTISSSMLVRYDATKTSTPSKRRNVYAASGTQDFNNLEESHENISLRILTPHQMTYIRYIRANIAENPPQVYLVS